MDSIDSNVDLELIAAFIDGRLSGEERARAVKLLADSDEALELYASTLRQQQDVPDAKVVPIVQARRYRQWKVLVPVAAAAAAVLAIVPTLVSRGGQAVMATQYATELTQDPRFAGALGAGWEQRVWPVTRGGASAREPGGTRRGSPLESRLSFRLGVRSVDLQVALRRADTALAGRLTSEVLELLPGIGFSESVAASYTELRSRLATDPSARSVDRASRAERDLRDLLDPPSFALGQWAGAAELAARTGDTSFFESKLSTRFTRSATADSTLAAEDAAAVRRIAMLTKQKLGVQELDEVHGLLQGIIQRRGG
jgi:hypothetical protein